jgi:hypothetical protein
MSRLMLIVIGAKAGIQLPCRWLKLDPGFPRRDK